MQHLGWGGHLLWLLVGWTYTADALGATARPLKPPILIEPVRLYGLHGHRHWYWNQHLPSLHQLCDGMGKW